MSEKKEPAADLPETLLVVSMVRRVRTRRHRAKSATRHRFKQYIFPENRRLIRNRAIKVSREDVLKNLQELRDKEAAGLLEVRVGKRKLDLASLSLSAEPPAPLQPHRRPDSIEHDTPAGYMQSVHAGGVSMNDPALQRAAEKLAEAKRVEEQEEPAPPLADDFDPAAERGQTQLMDTTELMETEPAPAEEESSEGSEERSESKKSKKRSKK